MENIGKIALVFSVLFFAAFALAAAPAISGFSVAPKYTNNSDTTPNITITASDANGMQFSCDGITYSTMEAYSGSKSDFDIKTGAGCGPADGNKAVYVRVESIDALTATASDWIYLDNTAPTITVSTPASSSTVATNWIYLDVNDAVGASASPTIAVNGNTVSITGGTGCIASGTNYHCDGNLYSINAAGTYTITVNAADTAGNTATQASITALNYTDLTAPAQVAGLAATAGNLEVSLSWTASTAFDLNNYNIYMSTFSGFDTNSETLIATVASGTAAFTKTGLTNGTLYYFKVSAKDKSANEGADSAEASATPADTSAPTGSITVSDYTKTATPTLTLSGSSGTAEMRLSCNDSSWTSAITYATSYSSFDITSGSYGCPSSRGSRNVYAQFRKSGGLWSSSYSDSTLFDSNAPSISFGAPANNSTVNSTTVTVEYVGIEDINGCGVAKYYVKIDAGNWIDNTSSTSRQFTSLINGLHTAYVKAADNADNNSAEYALNFTVSTSSSPPDTSPPDTSIDSTNPTATWVNPSDKGKVYGKVALQASASDNKGIKKVIFYQGSKIIGTATAKTGDYYSVDWETAGLEETNYVLTATAYDTSNNSTSDMITVTVSESALENNADENGEDSGNSTSEMITELEEEFDKYYSENYGAFSSAEAEVLVESFNAEIAAAKSSSDSAETEASIANARALLDEMKQRFQKTVEDEKTASFDALKIEQQIRNAMLMDANTLESAIRLTKEARPERTISIVKMDENGVSYYLLQVTISLSSSPLKARKLIETIPKEIAASASLVKSSSSFRIILDDPVIEFDISSGSTEVSYYIDKKFKDLNSAMKSVSDANMALFAKTQPIVSESAAKPSQNSSSSGLLIGGIAVAVIIILAIAIVFLNKKNKGIGNQGFYESSKPAHGEAGLVEVKRKFNKKEAPAAKDDGVLSKFKYKKGFDGWD